MEYKNTWKIKSDPSVKWLLDIALIVLTLYFKCIKIMLIFCMWIYTQVHRKNYSALKFPYVYINTYEIQSLWVLCF